MNHADIAALMEGIAPVVRGFVEKTFAPLAQRLSEIEKRLGELPDAAALVTAEVEKVAAMLPEQIERAAKDAADALPKAPTAEEVAALIPPPEAGKSVTVEDVRPLVAEVVVAAVASLPPAKDGESVDPVKVKEMVDEAVAALPGPKEVDPELVATLVDKAVAPAVERAIAGLPPVPTAQEIAALVPPPEPGKSVSIDDVRPLLDEAVAGAFANMRVPKDGKDVEPETIRAVVEEAVKALPVPENGKDATPEQIAAAVEKVLATWERPKDGESVTVEKLQLVIDDVVSKAVEALPVPKDGDDGVGLAGALKDHEGCLVLTLTDGAVVKLGRVDGEPGKSGLDGLGFEDLQVIHDGERGFKFVFTRGEQVKEFAFSLPVVLDRGVFKDGTEYEAGDGTTFGGSFWIAQDATKDKPGTSDAWRLSVKKGRDGQDLRTVEPKPPTPVKLR